MIPSELVTAQSIGIRAHVMAAAHLGATSEGGAELVTRRLANPSAVKAIVDLSPFAMAMLH